MPHRSLRVFLLMTLLSLVSCTSRQKEAISLASFTEHYVEVSIALERDSEGSYLLSAKFTPPEGYHLYSKDIPLAGIDGLGRPTLLELTPQSSMKTRGTLIESVPAETPEFGPQELLVYPAGAVTLSLPVELPAGTGWIEEEIRVTYMACSASQCKPPVISKHVLVPIPSANFGENE